jgi:hypothetical protein
MTTYFSPATWKPVLWIFLGSLVSLNAATISPISFESTYTSTASQLCLLPTIYLGARVMERLEVSDAAGSGGRTSKFGEPAHLPSPATLKIAALSTLPVPTRLSCSQSSCPSNVAIRCIVSVAVTAYLVSTYAKQIRVSQALGDGRQVALTYLATT